MRRAPRRAKPCIMMKFVAAKTINAIYWNTYIVTASHGWRCRCGLVRARCRKLSESGFTGFYDWAGLRDLNHRMVPILMIRKSRKS